MERGRILVVDDEPDMGAFGVELMTRLKHVRRMCPSSS